MPSLIDGRGCTPWFKARESNSTGDTALTGRITLTRPDNLIPMTANGKRYNGIALIPFGTDADGEVVVISVQMVGVVQGNFPPFSHDTALRSGTEMYVIQPYTSLSCTFGSAQGGAGGLVDNSQFIADTIAPTDAGVEDAVDAVSGVVSANGNETNLPALWAGLIGHIAEYVRLEFTMGTSASANALVKLFNPT